MPWFSKAPLLVPASHAEGAIGSSAAPAAPLPSEPSHAAGCMPRAATALAAVGPALPDKPQLVEIARTTLPGRAANVRRARHFIANALGQAWPRLDDVLTLTSELASNAIRHTASGDGGYFDVAVAACAARNHVRVQVADQGGASVPS